jgi:hypothetical protein
MGFLSLLPIRTWAYLGLALCISGFIAWGFMAIRGSGVASCEREHAELNALHVELAAAQAHSIALQDAEVISWADNARTNTVFKTLWRDHETVAYTDCSLSPAGRVLFNRAIAAATDLSDTIEQGESYQTVTKTGNWDTEGNSGSPSPAHGTVAPTGDRPGSSAENVGSAWVVGGGY